MSAPPLLRVLRTSTFVDFYRRGVVAVAVRMLDASVREHRFEFEDADQVRALRERLERLESDMRRAGAATTEGQS